MMKEAFMAIEEKCGAECRLVRIQDTVINTCIGCETCMMNHLKGNWDFRCVHKTGSDHFYFIEQLMREADAIIVSSPAYNLLPTGQLIKFLNKMHASGNYRDVVEKENKIGAAFSIGGTDWTNFTLNVCKMIAMELTGSYDALADAVHFDFVPAKGAILLEDEMMARMHQFGETVAEALLMKEKGETPSYSGLWGSMSRLSRKSAGDPSGRRLLSPVSDKGEDQYCGRTACGGVLRRKKERKNRWSVWGKRLHDDNIRKGHKKGDRWKSSDYRSHEKICGV